MFSWRFTLCTLDFRDSMWVYKFFFHSVYDGDGTFRCDIKKTYSVDVGFNIHIEFSLVWKDREVRLYGVDTPEVRGEQREAGIIVRDFAREKLLGKWKTGETQKDESGKYGRILADFKVDRKWFAQTLLKMEYAHVYDGGTKKVWTKKQLNKIIASKK